MAGERFLLMEKSNNKNLTFHVNEIPLIKQKSCVDISRNDMKPLLYGG